MQKKILALAIAGLASGAAFAQTNVTIYGIMDAGFYSWSGNGERSTGIQSSGYSTSRLGFKGEEALGNGLKAVFNLETELKLDSPNDPDAGANNSIFGSARAANVGLAGNFGRVLVGTMPSLSDDWHGAVSEPMGNISARNLVGNVVGRFSNEKARGISYVSPNLNGFDIGVLYGTRYETDTDYMYNDTTKTWSKSNLDNQAYYQVGVRYMNGPFAAAATYAYLDDNYDAAKDWTVGMTYDFKVVKLYAAYERSQDVGMSFAGTTGTLYPSSTGYSAVPVRDNTNSEWTVGARIPVSAAGTVSLSYAVNKNDPSNTDLKGMHLGYEHDLSKRTTLYAAYMRISNDDNAKYVPISRYNNTSKFSTFNNAGDDYNGFTVGLRHLF